MDYNFLMRKDRAFLVVFICFMLLLSVYASVPIATSQSSEPFAATGGSMETTEPPSEQETKLQEETMPKMNQLKSTTSSDKESKATKTGSDCALAQGPIVKVYVDQPLGYIPFVAPGGKVTIDILIETSGIDDWADPNDGIAGWGLDLQVDPDVLNISLIAPPPPPFPPQAPAKVVGAQTGYFLYEYGQWYGFSTSLLPGTSDSATGYWDDIVEAYMPLPTHGPGDDTSLAYPKLVTLEVTSKSDTQPCTIELIGVEYVTPDQFVHPVDIVIDGYYGPPPPHVEFTYSPSMPLVDQTVTFNASASYDPDGGDLVSYEWDFGDAAAGSGNVTTHAYAKAGIYTVTLNVTDDEGLWATGSQNITIYGPPVASFTFTPSHPAVGQPVAFNASASTPNGGTITSYTWNFDDGNTTAVSTPIVTHTYTSGGTYTVSLNITNDAGLWDTEFGNVTVARVPYVLFDQTHGTDSISYYSVWVSNLTNRGYIVDTHTSGSITPSILADYDVFVIPQAHTPYLSGELTAIQSFVSGGGGLLVIGDDTPTIYTDLTSFAGIGWMSYGYSGVTTDITPHEVTREVSSVYLSSPIAMMNVTGLAQDLVRDPAGNIMLAVSEQVGRVAGFADEDSLWDYGILQEDNLRLANNMIDWLLGIRYEHELAVTLDAPNSLKPGDSSLLNATVFNYGMSNETDVELSLLINDVVVSNVTITELVNGTSHTLSCLWTPTLEGAYNVTAHVPLVPDEEFTGNNMDTKMVTVSWIANVLVYTDDYVVPSASRYPIVALDNLGMPYTHYADDPSGFLTALTAQSWDLVVVSHNNYFAFGDNWEELEQYVLDGGLLVLSTFDVDGSHSELTTLWSTLGVQWSSDMPYPEPVHRWMPTHPIFTSPNTISDLTYYIEGYGDDGDYVAATTGTPIAGFTISPTASSAAIVVGNVHKTVLMNFLACEFRYDEDGDGKLDTVELWENAITFVITPLEHELTVSLETPRFLEPGDSSFLNATVYNGGLSNETAVELYLLIDGTMVNNVTIPELVTGASYRIDHFWTPAVEAVYNITAYAPSVPDEDIAANNVMSAFVNVQYPMALFKNQDPWGHPTNERVLSLYGIPYVVFGSSDFGLVDLSAYSKAVIASVQDQDFYSAMDTYRWWFEDYVSDGGILEIHAAHYSGTGWVGILPGGLQYWQDPRDYVTIVDPTHPVLTTPNPITAAELDGWSASVHGYFDTYPADSHIVIVEDSTGYPAYLEFDYGAGVVVASSQTLEWAYRRGYSLILENSLLHVPARPPVASFVYAPAAPYVGDVVTFNASASYDPDGTIIRYEWDFGDGFSDTGIAVAHTYWAEGIFPVNLTVTDGDGKADTALVNVTVRHRVLRLKLSGEHDYLFMENVKIRVAALVTDAETMEPISDANITIAIYDPEGNRWIADNMTARLSGGIYEWDSAQTLRELMSRGPLVKGVYLAHVQASCRGGPVAADILEFHIDPPGEALIQLPTILLLLMAGSLLAGISVWFIDHRRHARELHQLKGAV